MFSMFEIRRRHVPHYWLLRGHDLVVYRNRFALTSCFKWALRYSLRNIAGAYRRLLIESSGRRPLVSLYFTHPYPLLLQIVSFVLT